MYLYLYTYLPTLPYLVGTCVLLRWKKTIADIRKIKS